MRAFRLVPGGSPLCGWLIRNARAVVAVLGFVTLPASAGLVYDESVNGELSDDRLSPTVWGTLEPGSNQLGASTAGTDLEYLTFTIPAGLALGRVMLEEYVSDNDTAFIGIQSGTTFTVSPSNPAPQVGELLGWTHFGTGGVSEGVGVGTDILDDIGSGEGAIGFTPPLGSGTYTIWLQQFEEDNATYRLDFQVIPEPRHAGWAAAALLGGLALLRRIRGANR